MSNETSTDDWHRHHGIQPGIDMIEAVWLPGYNNRSIWGWDAGMSTFFAQIWANGSHNDTDMPDLWLSPPNWTLPHADTLVVPIVEHTGADPLDVVRAMGIAHPTPTLKDDAAIFEHTVEALQRSQDALAAGAADAVDWMLGHSEHSPLSRTRPADHTNPAPSPAEVDAERCYATGLVYITQDPYVVGAETALVFALSNN